MPRARKKTTNVVAFPPPPVEEHDQTIICQIGNDRFAIHFDFEDLPPARPAIPIKKAGKP